MNYNEIASYLAKLEEDYQNSFNEDGELIVSEKIFNETNILISEQKQKLIELAKNNSLIKIDTKESGLSRNKVNELIVPFLGIATKYTEKIKRVEELKSIPKEEITEEVERDAREMRISIKNLRTTSEKIKDDEKSIYLKTGNVIQKRYNILKTVFEEQEKILLEIEKYSENLELQRILKLNEERKEIISKFNYTGTLNLGTLTQEQFEEEMKNAEILFNFKKSEEEKAEKERIERENKAKEENERIRKENEALRKANDELRKVEEDKRKEEENKQNEILQNERLKKEERYKNFIEDNKGNFDKIMKEDGKVILYKKIREFII